MTKFASPLGFDPGYQAYWSERQETLFGANTNALNTRFTGFSFCRPLYRDYLLHALVGHAIKSASCTQGASATVLLLPEWLGWSKNGCMSWINNYPEHACVLANFSANSMLFTITDIWLPTSAQQE